MKITAALAYWGEKAADLAACVTAAAQVADRIVAVDGAYRRYPGATVKSSHWSRKAIEKAAAEAGIECVIHEPAELWAGQVAKRTFLLQEAAKDSDWIIVIDTDHIIHVGDAQPARILLEQMPASVRSVGVDFFTPANEERPADQAATNWHAGMVGDTLRMAAIFRSAPDLRVVGKHWIYQGTYNGSPVELRYGDRADADLPHDTLWIEHRTMFRTEEQLRAGRAFCNDRIMVVERTGQEDDVPGLPEPVFDYDTMPYSRRTPTAATEAFRAALTVDTPLRVVTLGEAASGLLKGVPVVVRVHGGSMRPRIMPGESVVLDPSRKPEKGDVVLAKVRNKFYVHKVAAIGADGRCLIANERGHENGWSRSVYGVVVRHGNKV